MSSTANTRLWWRAAGSFAALAVSCTVALAFDDAKFCVEMKQAAERSRSDIGTMLDLVTRMDGIGVLCGTRTITFYKFINVAPSAFRDGWKERKQKQWDAIYCADPAWRQAVKAGWAISSTVTFVEGTRIYLEAQCE